MTKELQELIKAEKQAIELFDEIEKRGLVQAGKTEKELNSEVYDLAKELFSIQKYWHKRIVRSGRNTLLPYRENPPILTLKEDDIVFFDFGPVFEEWEADIGRTYIVGNDPYKSKLKNDVEAAWQEGRAFYLDHKDTITGAEFYEYTNQLAKKYSWDYGNEHCGHLIGNFPHEKIIGEERINYIHPENTFPMSKKDQFGNERHWIYEIHFVDPNAEIGGFFEQILI